ncbi:hypothetical protein K4F52_006237 [Lecanicillium sp. MT-2017a]|nr:hypothetical protein K4F52_006237 [Lecanicillium sp. MT-2017a]
MSSDGRCEANDPRETDDRPRNETFGSDHPFDDNSSLSLLGATGSLKYFNATSAQYSWSGWSDEHEHGPSTGYGSFDDQQPPHPDDEAREEEGNVPAKRKDDLISFYWRSRDNRKGRHALVLRRGEDGEELPHGTLEPTNTLHATLRGIVALFTKFPYWDISWWVAIVFTVGSLLWIENGFILLPPLGGGSSQSLKLASTWSAFAASAIFLVGSFLLLLEAVNANRSGCFGWAVERGIKGKQLSAEIHPGECEHHYHSRDEHEKRQEDREASRNEDTSQNDGSRDEEAEGGQQGSGSWEQLESEEDDGGDNANKGSDHSHLYSWLWWPSWHDLRTHFLYEIGFLACLIQVVSAVLFFLSKLTTLPGINSRVSQGVVDGTNWAPQALGCLGFIAACLLFMFETQQKWYIPAPSVLGWHVGFWKLIGCVLFMVSAVLGPFGEHGSESATANSGRASFYGSWAILLGSLCQWYESLDKYPVVQEGTSRYSEWNESFIEDDEKRRNTENQ